MCHSRIGQPMFILSRCSASIKRIVLTTQERDQLATIVGEPCNPQTDPLSLLEMECVLTHMHKREIELNSRALGVLERQLKLTFAEDDEEAFIFISPITNKPFLDDQTPRKSYWYPTLDALKIRRRPAYNTRHTYATLSLMAGANPMWVARQLGHTSMKMLLEVYAKWIDDSDDSRERNKMDLLFANAPSPPQNEVSQEGKLNENKTGTGGEGGIRTRVRILS
ncbi:MAG: tyrosine-type recombinase/integrase [Burkholderiales bacterium]|nr:tyrosine-type recombinase/integrase [Burkholderiales bacterium]